MVGVEFVEDRATREPDGDLPDRLIAACADAGLLRPDVRHAPRGRALDPAARRHGGGGRRGRRDLRRDARVDPARLTASPTVDRALVRRRQAGIDADRVAHEAGQARLDPLVRRRERGSATYISPSCTCISIEHG